MKLEPKYYVLEELLERRLFRIPEYQRAYSWESKQRQDLFDDITKILNYPVDRHHFMATVVCLNTNKKEEIGADEFTTVNIVDGQQRLTTLIILLKAISKQLDAKKQQEKELKKKLNALLVKGDKRLILLQTNHDSYRIFIDYLKDGTVPEGSKIQTQADLNLVEAFTECEAFVKEWLEKKRNLIDLLRILRNRLGFVFYVLDDEGSVYTVFEVLNSRGLEVDWLDKCKSMLMGIAFEKFKGKVASEHHQDLHKTWGGIYRLLGTKHILGEEILRFAATLKHDTELSKTLSSEDAFDFFRSYCTEKPTRILEVGKWLYDVTDQLTILYSNPRLSAVTDIAHARLLAIAILQSSKISKKEREDILDLWERITFKIFGLYRKDARTSVGEYVRTAYKVYKNQLTAKEIIHEFNNISAAYPIAQAIQALKNSDLYNGWENDLRYFLYRYEESLCKKQGSEISNEMWAQIWSKSASTTIEHIYPQSPSKNWVGKMGRGRNQLENNVNRIGNLILLPPHVNSQAGQKTFIEKKKIYKSNFLRMHDEVIKCRDWDKVHINNREKVLLDWARETWHD
jgi:Protein of unknown function DUF262/Protein of unknown function (DUF1524)